MATTTAPTTKPDHRGCRGVDQPGQQAPDGLHVVHVLLAVVDQAVGRVPAEGVGPDEQDVAADPQHRDRADGRQRRQQFGHSGDQSMSDPLCES